MCLILMYLSDIRRMPIQPNALVVCIIPIMWAIVVSQRLIAYWRQHGGSLKMRGWRLIHMSLMHKRESSGLIAHSERRLRNLFTSSLSGAALGGERVRVRDTFHFSNCNF